jgi:hypothetical protein
MYQPISLGSACEAKFQISRKLYFSYYGKKSEAGFRMQMLPPERGEKAYGWHAFDWQRTPFSALLAYLERDFAGVFEQSDLQMDGDFIFHRTLGAEHSHQFPGFNSTWTAADVERVYPHVQRNLQKRASAFRRMLTQPGPYLYVWTASSDYEGTDHLPPVDQVRRLLDLLSSGSPDHQFHLLMVANEGKDADYSSLEGRVTKAYREPESGKSPTMAWEGNDAGWERILAPFILTLHETETLAARPTAASPAMAQLSPAARKTLFSRLMSR